MMREYFDNLRFNKLALNFFLRRGGLKKVFIPYYVHSNNFRNYARLVLHSELKTYVLPPLSGINKEHKTNTTGMMNLINANFENGETLLLETL